MNRLFNTIGFLTRIPVKSNSYFDENFNKGIVFFPTVGAILGICYLSILYMTSNLLGNFNGSVIVVTATIFFTGGLHLDGLGDTFDGLYSNREKEKILEIMKDSRLGTNALLAILVNILLKIGTISSLIEINLLYSILIMPIIGRMALVFSCYKGKAARKNGMGNTFIGMIEKKDFIIALGSGFAFISLISIYFSSYETLFLNTLNSFFIFFFVYLFRIHVYKKINGITGDILGAICEISETLYLITTLIGVTIWRRYI